MIMHIIPTSEETLQKTLGSSVSIKDYPYVVGLVTLSEGHSEQFCGGTIIAKSFVLTAAHCLESKEIIRDIESGKVVIRGGETNIREGTGHDHHIHGYKIHEHYSSPNHKYGLNDIALIQVKDQLGNSFEESIEYAGSDSKYLPGPATILGWGRTDSEDTNRVQLRAGEVEVVANCSDYLWFYDPGWICVKSNFINRKGDDGGPLIQNKLLIGIISFNKVCSSDCPTIYTRVAHFNKWINTTMTSSKFLHKE